MVVNQHGHTFLEFLNDAKMCVLNGRFRDTDDNFTSVSTKGKSVVDYMCVPNHDNFSQFESFQVIPLHHWLQSITYITALVNEASCPTTIYWSVSFDIGPMSMVIHACRKHRAFRQLDHNLIVVNINCENPRNFLVFRISKESFSGLDKPNRVKQRNSASRWYPVQYILWYFNTRDESNNTLIWLLQKITKTL